MALLASCPLLTAGGCGEASPQAGAETPAAAATTSKAIPRPGPSSSAEADDGLYVARASAGAAQLQAGEPLELRLEAEAPGAAGIILPELNEKLGPFDVERVASPERTMLEGGTRLRLSQQVVLSTYETGAPEIPALTFRFTPDPAVGGEERLVEVPPIAVEVASLVEDPFDPAQFADVKPLAPLPPGIPMPLVLGASAALPLAAAVAGAVILWRLMRRRSAPPPTDAAAWARSELDRLAAENLPAAGRGEEFFVRLTAIVRSFLEMRLGIAATEQTTDEFLAELRAGGQLGRDEAHLERLLRLADLVKFAREDAAASACAQALAAGRSLVDAVGAPSAPTGTPGAGAALARAASASGGASSMGAPG